MINSASTLVTLVALVGHTWAQTSDVVCSSAYSWANNKLGQSPCVVASYLVEPCEGKFNIPALPVGQHYEPNDANVCLCSTVTYALVSACGDCQGADYTTWSYWSENCTASDIYYETYPGVIPSGTAVPHWAYLAVEDTNYNATLARADAISRAPKKSHTGAIVGGVVGAIVVILLLVAAFVWWKRKKNAQDARGVAATQEGQVVADDKLTQPVDYNQQYGAGAAVGQGVGSLGYNQSNVGSPPMSPTMTAVSTTPRPYDPADPATYPPAQGYGNVGNAGYGQPTGYGQVGGYDAGAAPVAGYGAPMAMPVPQHEANRMSGMSGSFGAPSFAAPGNEVPQGQYQGQYQGGQYQGRAQV